MGFLKIKPAQAEALQAIAKMSPERFSKLADLLWGQDSPSIKATQLLEVVRNFSGDEDFSDAFCTQLISLAMFRRVEKIEPEELFDSLFGGMENAGFSEETRDWYTKIRPDFVRLLNCDSVRFPAKALHLSTDHEQLFVSANVVTDVRPVFDGDRSELVGAVVVQTLRAHYLAAGGEQGKQQVSLALDIDDIQKLIDELEKALLKAQTAKNEFGKKTGKDIFVVGEETYGFS